MSFLMLFITAVGLSMDAFAVAMCKGLCLHKIKFRHMLTVGIFFGVFQGLMPLIGYFLAINFASQIKTFDHWVAFGLLAFLGVKMIIDAFKDEEEEGETCSLDKKNMVVLSLATSIDALAVGISFAALKQDNICLAVLLIGVVTFALSAVGVKIGSIFGEKFKKGAEVFGGIVLIGIGLKILLEHLVG